MELTNEDITNKIAELLKSLSANGLINITSHRKIEQALLIKSGFHNICFHMFRDENFDREEKVEESKPGQFYLEGDYIIFHHSNWKKYYYNRLYIAWSLNNQVALDIEVIPKGKIEVKIIGNNKNYKFEVVD
ncbi:hypothetical protein H6G33_10395 [Calothrix sp. FACHB-1219]|uniref:hypothetical protein n=1 Tax=unclassified Calothrix TaxID=2619626 RepID=UPI0016831BB5|nr:MULTISPECIES: hypothetical protein [unclassified Calothrix]MBD2201756.1 hypothetical protein [Calothrix sp. FACHB-168]MBD2217442.1 hypothetical protein [Calothrix sp. FACHB-1219]